MPYFSVRIKTTGREKGDLGDLGKRRLGWEGKFKMESGSFTHHTVDENLAPVMLDQ